MLSEKKYKTCILGDSRTVWRIHNLGFIVPLDEGVPAGKVEADTKKRINTILEEH